MRILEVAETFWPEEMGGTKRLVTGIAVGLKARGHEVHLLSRCPQEDRPLRNISGIPIHRYPVDRRGLVRSLWSECFSVSRSLRALHQTLHPDWIFFHHPLPGLAVSLTRHPAGCSVLPFFYAPSHLEFQVEHRESLSSAPLLKRMLLSQYPLFLRWIQKRGLAGKGSILCFSDYSRQQAQELFKVSSHRLLKIPVGIDLDRFSPSAGGDARASWGFPQDRPLILTVRRLRPRMGLLNLIQGFSSALSQGSKAFLAVAGEGPLKDDLQREVHRLGLNEDVRLLGFVPEERLPGLYAMSDLFIMPTECLEGYGLALAEALASGVPVLGTPVGAIPELLGQLSPELLLEGTSPDQMARGLMKTLASMEQVKRLRPEARLLAERSCSWNRCIDAIEAVLSRRMP